MTIHRYGGEKKLTFAAAKAELTSVGMTISRDTVGSGPTGSGEYRVTFKGGTFWSDVSKDRAERLAHYTPDLDDALATGLRMAREGRRL